MSDLDDDILRGCLENGEPIEARWGQGSWSNAWDNNTYKQEPEFEGGECPRCHKMAWYLGGAFFHCEECGADWEDNKKDPNRVRCTSDGDYPVTGQQVIFEDEDGTWIGGYNPETRLWWCQEDEGMDRQPTEYPIYWKPAISLEFEYEQQKERPNEPNP